MERGTELSGSLKSSPWRVNIVCDRAADHPKRHPVQPIAQRILRDPETGWESGARINKDVTLVSSFFGGIDFGDREAVEVRCPKCRNRLRMRSWDDLDRALTVWATNGLGEEISLDALRDVLNRHK